MINVPRYLLLAISAGVLSSNVAAVSEDLVDTMFLRYYGESIDEYVDYSLDNATILAEKLDSKKKTVLHIHGFTESADSNSVKTLGAAFIKRGDSNFIAVDYRNISNQNYLKVALSASTVGRAVAEALNAMVKNGSLDYTKLHIVSHSLGSQVARYAAKNVTFKIERITGLDPAGPFFYVFNKHLGKGNAKFVDIIHTDAGVYGLALATGDVDFYPNGGTRLQPGCSVAVPLSSDDFCSHHRSWEFFAESTTNEDAFIATKCSTKLQFYTKLCNDHEQVVMGYATSNTTKGTYYLTTASSSPFGLGESGATY